MKYFKMNTLGNVALAVTVLPALLIANSVAAADFNYDFVEVGGTEVDTEFGDLAIDKTEITSFFVSGSYSYSDTIAVGGGYGIGKGDTSGSFTAPGGNFRDSIDLEVTVASVFVLYHDALNDKADYQVGADYTRTEFESDSPRIGRIEEISGDDDSKGVFGAVRYRYSNEVELEFGASYDFDADEDELGYDITARYQLDKSLELGAFVDPSGDETTLGVTLRKNLFR